MDNKKSLQYYVNSSQLSKEVDKHYFSWQNIDEMCTKIVLDINKDEHWRPDYIIGITRGGNIPATIISHMMNIRGEALKINLRDNGQFSESNTWMAQDAFEGKNILIVDDINDTGNTFNWLMEDWKKSMPSSKEDWDRTFGYNVRFATLVENYASDFGLVKYYAYTVNKAEKDVWLVYPWENTSIGEYDG